MSLVCKTFFPSRDNNDKNPAHPQDASSLPPPFPLHFRSPSALSDSYRLELLLRVGRGAPSTEVILFHQHKKMLKGCHSTFCRAVFCPIHQLNAITLIRSPTNTQLPQPPDTKKKQHDLFTWSSTGQTLERPASSQWRTCGSPHT